MWNKVFIKKEGMFMYTIIKENECGYLLKNGVFVRLLFSGKHRYSKLLGYEIKTTPMTGYVKTSDIPLAVLLNNYEFVERTVKIDIPDSCIAIHFVNGTFKSVLIDREAICWNVFEKNTFQLIDITSPEMGDTIAPMYRDLLPAKLYKKIDINEGEIGLLYYDNHFEKQLPSGTYYFWNYTKKVTCKIFNKKLQQLEINGQEILTADKVGIRLNIICSYKITDPLLLVQNIDDLKSQLYVYTQLIMREYIGRYKLDELLSQKEEISKFVFERLVEHQEEYYVAFSQAGIKDIILPGEIRDIMNTVLLAEKKAQANVITRREEVASTRSLLNTAKLMEENKTLFKLKELEYLERICDKIGTISVSGGSGVLEQLRELF